MRHARRAAARAATAVLVAVPIVGGAPRAQAIDFPGGTAAPRSTTGLEVATNPVRAGGASAPTTEGTGGVEYGAAPAKPRVVHRSAASKSSHGTRHSSKSKAKPTPKPRPAPKPKPAPKPAPTTPAPAPTQTPTGAPTPTQTVAEGAVFPIVGAHSFGDAENRFGAPREGHVHEGQDVLAAEGLQVVAPLAGTILTTAYQAGGAGWYAVEQTADGLSFLYAHCQASSLAVSPGQAVRTGQAVCLVGQTGDATGPHLHFEVWVGGWQTATGYPIDPLPYLQAWGG